MHIHRHTTTLPPTDSQLGARGKQRKARCRADDKAPPCPGRKMGVTGRPMRARWERRMGVPPEAFLLPF